MDINTFISGVTNNISNSNSPRSISPATVGQAFVDLAQFTEQGLNSVVSGYKGLAQADTIPDNSIQNQFYDATAGITYINFLNVDSDPIQIPLTDSGKNVIAARLSFNGSYWSASWSTFELSNYYTKPDSDGRYLPISSGQAITDLQSYVQTGLTQYIKYADLSATSVISPTISVSWSATKADGTTTYTISSPSSQSITVDKGARVNQTSYYRYSTPSSSQSAPASVSGNYGTTIPAPNTNSQTIKTTGITSNASYSVTFTKPKTGLIVNGSQVVSATGTDTSSDSISVSFVGKGYLFYSTNPAITDTEINNLIATNIDSMNGAFQSSVSRTFNSVTAGSGLYTYIIYDAALPNISQIIMNGATPVLGAFTKLSNLTIINEALSSVAFKVYRSNITQAFTSASLAIS